VTTGWILIFDAREWDDRVGPTTEVEHMKEKFEARPSRMGAAAALLLAGMLVIAACTASGGATDTSTRTAAESTIATTSATSPGTAGCADVVDASIEPTSGGFRVSVTLLTADTGWEKYADAWEVRTIDGTVLGTRVLAHPHVDEQPFTRSLNGVAIPPAVTSVEIAARDSIEGFCGTTLVVNVPAG